MRSLLCVALSLFLCRLDQAKAGVGFLCFIEDASLKFSFQVYSLTPSSREKGLFDWAGYNGEFDLMDQSAPQKIRFMLDDRTSIRGRITETGAGLSFSRQVLSVDPHLGRSVRDVALSIVVSYKGDADEGYRGVYQLRIFERVSGESRRKVYQTKGRVECGIVGWRA